MSDQSSSKVAFGRLMTEIADHLSDGGPVPVALAQVRDHVGAAAVVLRLARPNAPVKLYFDRGFEAEAEALGHKAPAELLESRQGRYVQARATTAGADNRSELKLTLYRPAAEGDFTSEEEETVAVLLSQIARTLALSVRLRHQRVEATLYSGALESLQVGVVLLTAEGKVHTMSPLGRQMLLARDGITAANGRLRAVEAGEDRSLQTAIQQVCAQLHDPDQSRALALTKKSGSRGIGIVIRPVSEVSGTGARIAVYIRDSDVVPEFRSDYVRQIFDLTPAEAAVTHRLTAGLSLEDTALALQISRNTARAHLRSIFLKNGISRQTELVRLVLNSAALLGSGCTPARAMSRTG